MGLKKRAVTAVSWNIIASLASMVLLFGRAVWLARLLPVETFGIYAGASAIISLTSVFVGFGMGGAFMHRSAETADEELAAAVHFTLILLFTSIWASLLTTAVYLFATGPTRFVMWIMIAITTINHLSSTPQLMLARRVVHRRLALIQVITALCSTTVAVSLAWHGFTLWAILSSDITSMVVRVITLYGWRRVWLPQLAWRRNIVGYYLRFGSRNLVATVLEQLLDRLDDLWIRFTLDEMALGFYSRAYTFATYPRRVLAAPVNAVVGGTYAELKSNRHRLSQAFFRTNALLIRSGFCVAGILALVAPEFIRLVLDVKWLPMLDAFRLMLVFTLLDPIRATVSSLFLAVGRPGQLIRIRIVQLAVLLMGLATLGRQFGITGVALSVNAMLVVGIVIMFWRAHRYVDFSVLRLFVTPGIALIMATLAARASLLMPGVLGEDWRTALVKITAFGLVYSLFLLILEARRFREIGQRIQNHKS